MSTTKQGKTWPPTKSYLKELERKAAKLDSILNKETQQAFVDEFKNNLAVLAALTPYTKWSEREKSCAEFAARKHPYSWHVYAANLPKE